MAYANSAPDPDSIPVTPPFLPLLSLSACAALSRPGVSLVFLTMAEASSGYLPMSHTDPYAPIDYPKLLRFFTNPDTSSIHSRQIALLKKVCRHNYAGYKVPELSYIAQLLEMAQERAVDNQVSDHDVRLYGHLC